MSRLCAAALILAGLLARPAWANDTVYYYSSDAQGSEVVITDVNRNVVERTYYGPYGEVLNRPLREGPGYTGHEEDAATGLDNMQQRYYDPSARRFPSVDPMPVDTTTGANFNRYAYANDNPYRYVDPDGRNANGTESPGERHDKDVQQAEDGSIEKRFPGEASGIRGMNLSDIASAEEAGESNKFQSGGNSSENSVLGGGDVSVQGVMLASNSDDEVKQQQKIIFYKAVAQEVQIVALHGEIPSDWVDSGVNIGQLSGGVLLDNMAGGLDSFRMYQAVQMSPNPSYAQVNWPINWSNVDWGRFASPDDTYSGALHKLYNYAAIRDSGN